MNIFVLTGAGIYAESGLGSFRGKTGLRTRFDPMKLAPPAKKDGLGTSSVYRRAEMQPHGAALATFNKVPARSDEGPSARDDTRRTSFIRLHLGR
jgi:NAD-dependent SIR2 family protein deacetylase